MYVSACVHVRAWVRAGVAGVGGGGGGGGSRVIRLVIARQYSRQAIECHCYDPH